MSERQEWDEDRMIFRSVFWDCPTCGNRHHEDEPTCDVPPSVPYVEVCAETAYGRTAFISNSVRVF